MRRWSFKQSFTIRSTDLNKICFIEMGLFSWITMNPHVNPRKKYIEFGLSDVFPFCLCKFHSMKFMILHRGKRFYIWNILILQIYPFLINVKRVKSAQALIFLLNTPFSYNVTLNGHYMYFGLELTVNNI